MPASTRLIYRANMLRTLAYKHIESAQARNKADDDKTVRFDSHFVVGATFL